VPEADEITGVALTGPEQPGVMFAPSSWNQSNVGVTDVVAPLESAYTPTFGLAGMPAETWPTAVHVVWSVE
jgi:hypothetical protein